MFLLFFVLNFIFLWLTVTIAVRVVGPFVRINRILNEIATGDIPEQIRFRRSDEIPFQELTEPFNRALKALRERREELDQIKTEVGAALEAGPSDAAKALARIKERLDKLV